MSLQISGTVIRRSNGSIDIQPDAGAPAERIIVQEGALGSKALPQMGDQITVTIDITKTAAQVEAEQPKPEATAASATGALMTQIENETRPPAPAARGARAAS